MSLTKQDARPPVSPLVSRTALAIYVAGAAARGKSTFDNLTHVEQARYEDMARAALTEAYREPVVLS